LGARGGDSPDPVSHVHLSLEPPPGPGVFFGVCVMRRVQIVEKPNETYSYIAVDQQTGEVPLRLSDRHALVALCQRLGWAVEENPHGKQGRDSEPVNATGHIDAKQDREPVGSPSSSARGSVRKDRILATEFLTRQRSNAQPSSSLWAFKAAAARLFAAHCSVYWSPALTLSGPRRAACASIGPRGPTRRLGDRADRQ
jgi:hypothetical protein